MLLPPSIVSEDGITYDLIPFEATLPNIQQLWTWFSKYKVMLSDHTYGNFPHFMRVMLDRGTVILKVNDVGIVYAEQIRPGQSAEMHYFFWDRKGAGRHKVMLTAIRWGMDSFQLHRVSTRIPRYAYSALHRAYKLGLRIEGIDREAILTDGKWHDVFRFSVLDHELTPEAIEDGHLERDENEQSWFGMLKYDNTLMRYVLRQRQ